MPNLTLENNELRGYQAEGVQKGRQGLLDGYLRQMFYAPTGAGKTVIAAAITKGARLKGKRVAFLVNRVQLVEQTSKVLTAYGISHGILQGENSRREYEHVLVCSVQTVARRGLPDIDLLIIDEAHAVAGSKDYRSLIATFAGKPVIGLSATPFAKGLGEFDEKVGGPLFERMVIVATPSELIADGYLLDCDIFAPSEPDMSGIKQVSNKFGERDYSDIDVGQAADKPELVGDIVAHWLKHARNTSTVAFASSIAHSQHIVEQFRAAGVTAEHLDCYDDSDERRAVLQRFESGQTKIISNSALLAEGWDAPFCETLILARPTRSLIRYLQMIGRVLRPHPGKTKALVFDHSGTVQRLGFPTDDFEIELDDGKPRSSSGTRRRDEPLPKPCSSCHFVKPAKVHKCPSCGFAPERVYEGEVGEGELKLVSKAKKKLMPQQAFYSQLLAICTMRGYSDGWAAHVFRDYFGKWPGRRLAKTTAEPTQEVLNFVTSRRIRHAKGRMKEAERAAA